MTPMRVMLAGAALLGVLAVGPAEARGSGGHGGHGSNAHSYSRGTGHHNSNYCSSCARDSHGHIARNPQVRSDFMARTGYPHGRPGYVVDHIIPLKRGGADAPWNMQWQTKAEAAAKDRWE